MQSILYEHHKVRTIKNCHLIWFNYSLILSTNTNSHNNMIITVTLTQFYPKFPIKRLKIFYINKYTWCDRHDRRRTKNNSALLPARQPIRATRPHDLTQRLAPEQICMCVLKFYKVTLAACVCLCDDRILCCRKRCVNVCRHGRMYDLATCRTRSLFVWHSCRWIRLLVRNRCCIKWFRI